MPDTLDLLHCLGQMGIVQQDSRFAYSEQQHTGGHGRQGNEGAGHSNNQSGSA